jgi:hypothetical protein
MDNITLMQSILISLSEIASEKTSPAFAQLIVKTILESLERKFLFLSSIRFGENNNNIIIPSSVNSLDEKELGKAIEAIIRSVYMNLEKQAGLFFVTELEHNTEPGVIPRIREIGVDLELMQIEHRQLYRNKPYQTRNESSPSIQKDISSFDEFSMGPSSNEMKLLSLLQNKDISEAEATNILNVSSEELKEMIVVLLNDELLHYVSENELKLTKKAISLLSDQNEINVTG